MQTHARGKSNQRNCGLNREPRPGALRFVHGGGVGCTHLGQSQGCCGVVGVKLEPGRIINRSHVYLEGEAQTVLKVARKRWPTRTSGQGHLHYRAVLQALASIVMVSYLKNKKQTNGMKQQSVILFNMSVYYFI